MIYDCFMFYNELDLLELRLNTLSDVVDEFVLVEGTETLQGDTKELIFKNNIDRFEEFKDSINNIVVDFPEDLDSSWEREYYLRNSIQEGLANTSDGDTVMVSDVDEIPRPEYVQKYSDKVGTTVFGLRLYYYFFNNHVRNIIWPGTVMTGAKSLPTPQDLRDIAMNQVSLEMIMDTSFSSYPFGIQSFLMGLRASIATNQWVRVIPDAGWHFSYLGDVEHVIEKIETFAHTELNEPKYKDPDKIAEYMNNGEHLANEDSRTEFVELDDTFPSYILENGDQFDEYIKG